MDTIDRWRIGIAAAAIVVLIALVAVMSTSDRFSRPVPVNGDTLGKEATETDEAYRARAAASLESNTTEPVFALITFKNSLTTDSAGAVANQLTRVDALVLANKPILSLPEPTEGSSRAEVFQEQLALKNLTGELLVGLVVYDRLSTLQALSAAPEVLAVEALPEDAA